MAVIQEEMVSDTSALYPLVPDELQNLQGPLSGINQYLYYTHFFEKLNHQLKFCLFNKLVSALWRVQNLPETYSPGEILQIHKKKKNHTPDSICTALLSDTTWHRSSEFIVKTNPLLARAVVCSPLSYLAPPYRTDIFQGPLYYFEIKFIYNNLHT